MGVASVVDGDTLVIHGTRVRLEGIDAPESAQVCHVDGAPWRCGQQAALALADKIGRAPIRCETHGRDHYQRMLGVCFLGREDINRWLVAQGWAFALREHSSRYTQDETNAKRAGLGVWRGSVKPPWEWREQHPASGRPPARPSQPARRAQPSQRARGCMIKGNITPDGQHIYHVPGMEYYAQTAISPGRGERWFCSEAEAQAAGWRRARR